MLINSRGSQLKSLQIKTSTTCITVRYLVSPQITLSDALLHSQRSSTQWACLLLMINPTVQTLPMKYVLAEFQPPDLLLAFELIKANGATLGLLLGSQLLVSDHRKPLLD